MLDLGDDYRKAVFADDRKVEVFISLGKNYDSAAADDVTSVSGSFLPLSNTAQIADASYVLTPNLATFEGDGMPTLPSGVAPPLPGDDSGMETGLWSSGISSSTGSISWSVTIQLSEVHTSAFRVYTDGPKITAATIQFVSDSGTVSRTPTYADGYLEVADKVSYRRIIISVTKIAEPYRHVRIAEVEFGASTSISSKELIGTLRFITETDPELTSFPLAELDFEVENVSGNFESDSPLFTSALDVGMQVFLSFTVSSGTKRFTVPCGRFTVAALDSSDTSLRVTAYDSRHVLTQIRRAWKVPSDVSVGGSLQALLSEYSVPHLISADLFSVYPEETVEFSADGTLADHVSKVQQAYGIYSLVSRDAAGTIRYATDYSHHQVGIIPRGAMYTYGLPSRDSEYNYISIGYRDEEGTAYLEKDMREDPEQPKNILSIADNPLISSLARAQAVMDQASGVRGLYRDGFAFEFRGDPAMEPLDVFGIYRRTITFLPRSGWFRRLELEYDGALRCSAKCLGRKHIV